MFLDRVAWAVWKHHPDHQLSLHKEDLQYFHSTLWGKPDTREPLYAAWGEGCNIEAARTVCNVAAKFNLDGWIAKDWDDSFMEGPKEFMICFGNGDPNLLAP